MRWSGSSYIGEGRVRQSPPLVRPIAAIVLGAALSGCAGLGMPFGEVADQNLTTGTVQKVSSRGKVSQSDWDAVRQAVAKAAADNTSATPVNWRNPATGTTGTITIHRGVSATNDPNCRNFATTINDMRGIRQYRGEACRSDKDDWQLYGVLADDSKLL